MQLDALPGPRRLLPFAVLLSRILTAPDGRARPDFSLGMAARDAREEHHVIVASRWWRSGLCDNEHMRRVHVLRITVKVSSGIEHTTRKFVVDSNPQEHMRIINR